MQSDESSWAGWAISGLAKKLNTVSGDMERAPSPATVSREPRPASAPITTSPSRPSGALESRTISASALHRAAVSPPPTRSSFLGDDDNEDNDPEAWGDLDEDKFYDAYDSTVVSKLDVAGKPYDDSAEPDFSSLLNKPKNPLPKGLARKSVTATSAGRGDVAGARKPLKTTGMRPIIAGAKPTPASRKKTEVKKVEDAWDEEGDGWGGWDD